ncbi:serine palmitoyltransferase [Trypanosoma theileri]|uniref:serine C-palmitoyltransferase n=1 Tax=Trypanosoma theileri TaxID=67003 RepID=A0A1X0NJD6_9TRYP|nr:serine palmitoyltransferase [Trypanosoma theileri]ORC84701.1 serine palmitoyltransferase [Trypanosoma theileri]
MPTYITSEDVVDSRGSPELIATKCEALLGFSVEASNKKEPVPPYISLQEKVKEGEKESSALSTQSQKQQQKEQQQKQEEEPQSKGISLVVVLTTYLTFGVLFIFSQVREWYRKKYSKAKGNEDYAPLTKDFDDLWQRHFYRRLRDCFNHPIDSRPSRVIGVMERVSHDNNLTLPLTGNIIPCVNLSSYNYLGFAEDTESITHQVIDSLDRYGIASCSAPQQAGQHGPLSELERGIAEFLNKDDAIVCGMGFGTNFRGLPALFGNDSLVISDSLNHSSLVNGVRVSGAKVKVFKHDNFEQLETLLREAVVLGRSTKEDEYIPWARIVIIVEGVYSMEGEIVDLARVVALKKKYGALLFVDEAHSIGAIGRTGRGVTEHCGVDTKDVDILMGTFTKSFGSIGGYISGDQSVIDYLRTHSSISLHCDTLAPPCTQQALSALDVIKGLDGTDLGCKRIQQLKENSRFFRQGLIARGFTVLGNDASPVVPVMLYHPCKLMMVARECMRRGLAVVIVGYPATPLLEGRVRFCVSAAHTREDLQFALDVMEDVAAEVHIQFNPRKPIEE